MSELHRLKICCVSALAAMIAVAQPAVAEPVQLSEADLRQLVPGVMIELDTPVGVRLPVQFNANGLMSGEAGRLEPYLGTPRDRGRWWIADGKLCQKWFRWLDAKPRCAIIMRNADRILWRDDSGEKGTATIVAEARGEPAGSDQVASQPSFGTPSYAGMTQQPVEPPPAARTQAPRVAATVAAPPAVSSEARSGPATPTGRQPTVPSEPSAAGTDRFAAPALASAVRRPPVVANPPQPTVAAAGAPSRGAPRASEPAPRRTAQARAFNPPIPLPTRRVIEKTEPPPSPFARAIAATGGTFRVRGVMSNDVLNVRQGPSEAHPVVGGLEPGAGRIRIVGRCVEAWCQIAGPRVAGWVNVVYLAPERIMPRRRFDPFQSLGGPTPSGS